MELDFDNKKVIKIRNKIITTGCGAPRPLNAFYTGHYNIV